MDHLWLLLMVGYDRTGGQTLLLPVKMIDGGAIDHARTGHSALAKRRMRAWGSGSSRSSRLTCAVHRDIASREEV